MGEANAMDSVNTCKQQLSHLIEAYANNGIYNMDEFAWFYKLLPCQTLAHKCLVEKCPKTK